MTLQTEPWQQRMIEEDTQLSSRIDSAIAFLSSEEFFRLPVMEKCLLMDQIAAMRKYREILRQRITIFMRQL